MILKHKLLFIFGLTSLVMIVAFGSLNYFRLWNDRIELIGDGIFQQLQPFDFALETFFSGMEGTVDCLAKNEWVCTRDDGGFTSFLQADEQTFAYSYTPQEQNIIGIFSRYRHSYPYVSSVYMGRENGAFVRSHPRETPTRYDPRERPWYVLAKESPGKVVRTGAYHSLTTPDVNLGFVKALVDENGVFFGVVGIDVTLERITEFIRKFKVKPEGRIFLIDEKGLVLASQEQGWRGRPVSEYSKALESLAVVNGGGPVSAEIQGEKVLVFHHRCTQQGWTVAVIVAASDVAKTVGPSVFWTVFSLSLGLVLLSALTLIGLNLFVISPLKALTREADYITRTGDLKHVIEIQTHDEIGDLASSFNTMVHTLGDAQDRLLQSEKELTQHRRHLEKLVLDRTTELRKALEQAKEADRIKSAFLATMSHELRTPLNSIIGFTGVLLQDLAGPLNPEQRKQLSMVQGSSRHLLALINDVLDISKIEAGQMKVTRELFDLGGTIAHVVESIRPQALKKGLALKVDIAPGIGAWTSDSRRVEQIILNLLYNAVKFTDRGEVSLKASIEQGRLRLSVADTGIGIKAEDLALIFQPFMQVDAGLTRRHEGTGLGLAICRRLADLLGGEIHAESEFGKGSVFTLTLPDEGKTHEQR